LFGILWCSSLFAAQFYGSRQLQQESDHREEFYREMTHTVLPSAGGYLAFRHLYEPKNTSMQLASPYGNIYGYPFYQRFALAVSDSLGRSGHRIGVMYGTYRYGWSTKDFLFFRGQTSYASSWFNQYLAGYWSHRPSHLKVQAGMFFMNREQVLPWVDSQPQKEKLWHLAWHWHILSAGLVSNGLQLQNLTVQLDWEAREAVAGRVGAVSQWMPLWQIQMRLADEAMWNRLVWRQNIWQQRNYLQLTWDPHAGEWSDFRYQWYSDSTHFFNVSVSVHNREGSLRQRVGISMQGLFIRLAYNQDDDLTLPKTTPVWSLSFHVRILGMAAGKFQYPGAPGTTILRDNVVNTRPAGSR
jgi:hypothetical protein